MPRPLTDEDAVERAAIDGRVAFALVAFGALIGLVALLDRVGAPEPIVRLMGPVAILAALAATGTMTRSMRISRFYAAGRAVPTPYVGFAGLAIAAALALPFVPPSRENAVGATGATGAIGAAVGLAIAALVVGPYLRRTGAFSIGDLIATRFPNLALRLGIAATIAVIGALVGLAGFALVMDPLTEILGLPRAVVAAALAFILVLIAAPGGVAGVVWAANGAAGALAAALVLPVGLLAGSAAMPLPWPSSVAWQDAVATWRAWQDGSSALSGLTAACGVACACAALMPLLSHPGSARDSRAALRGGVVTLAWCAVVGALAATMLVWGAVAVSRTAIGHAPDRLPAALYRASGAGLLDLCGQAVETPSAARTACAARGVANTLQPGDLTPRAPSFLIGAAASTGAGTAGLGLVAAALLAVGLALAASGFTICATALGHDLAYRVRDHGAQTSRRLATTRAILVGAVALGAVLTGARALDARLLVGLAATLAAVAVLPILILSIVPRAAGRDAVLALLVGLAAGEAILFAHAPTLAGMAQAALAGALAGTIAGLLASLVGGGARTEGRAFVSAVVQRDDALAPDKGA